MSDYSDFDLESASNLDFWLEVHLESQNLYLIKHDYTDSVRVWKHLLF